MVQKKDTSKTSSKKTIKKPKKKAPVKKTAAKNSASKKKIDKQLYWVGIGASAGGLEALREMVKKLPKRANNTAYIIAQHLSPKHQSMMVQLLGRETTLRVSEVENGTRPEAGVIYITPPNSDVFVRDGRMYLRVPVSEFSPKPSVDLFFTTLAEEIHDHAIGVILSGTGSDGAHGMRAVRAAGGLTIAQDPETAKYDGMPASAIETGCVDIIIPPEKIGPEISSLIRSPRSMRMLQVEEVERTTLQELLHMLKERSGVDFKDYKSGTLFRRINRRMTACNVLDLDEYVEYVQAQPQELDMLFKDIMITVTNFFRDQEAFEGLKKMIQKIVADKKEDDNIRVWVPGCATGEEVYSIIILFAEALGGLSQLQQGYNFQLFATDIDVEALSYARKGLYPATTLEGMDPKIRQRYFRHKDNAYEIIKAARDMVVFSRHNVFDDPPFLRLDLVSCRNLLIYFNTKLQNTVLNLFHYALNPTGVMFLGKSEALGQNGHLFQATDSKSKIYKRKLVTTGEQAHTARVSYATVSKPEITGLPHTAKQSYELPDSIIDALSPDSLLVDEELNVVRIYGDVQAYTQLSAGEASTNLVNLVHKDFRQELRALAYKALREQSSQMILPKKMKINGQFHKIHIIINVLKLKNSAERLLLVSFEKIKKIKEEEANISTNGNDPLVAELAQELSATKEHLQTVVEELETSNEELQSTNEEMQSTNEELQSSNEELETSNEELQSTNEELLTVNEELQIKSSELTATNEDLDNVKESIDMPLLVVDQDLRITRFNSSARDIFLLNNDSEGEALMNVPAKFDIPDLRKMVTDVIKTGKTLQRQLESEGNHYFERILPYRDPEGHVKGAVLTYVDNTIEQAAMHQLRESQERYDLAVQGSNAGIWDWDIKSGKMHWSALFLRMLGIKRKTFKPSIEAFEGRIHEDDRKDVMDILQAHLDRGFDFNVEFRMRKEDGGYTWLHARGQATWDEHRNPMRMTGSVYDVTERRNALDHLSKSNESLERFAYVCSHDLKEPARLIENFVGLFDESYNDALDEQGREYLGYIQDSAVRMQEMIKGILTYSQLENKNMVLGDVDVNEELAKVEENLKLSIDESGAKIVYSNLPVIRADPMQTMQIFQNLVGNALKFCQNRRPKIQILCDDNDTEWVFAVQDNGIGMKAEHTHKIFNVFQRLNRKEEFAGTGIGLSICQKIVTKHNGRIWVESKLGVGSTFYFALPKPKSKIKEQNNAKKKRSSKAG